MQIERRRGTTVISTHVLQEAPDHDDQGSMSQGPRVVVISAAVVGLGNRPHAVPQPPTPGSDSLTVVDFPERPESAVAVHQADQQPGSVVSVRIVMLGGSEQ
jgi:hypothetical protein